MTNKLFRQASTDDAFINQLVDELWDKLIAGKRIDTGEKPSKKKGKHGEVLETIYTNSVKHSGVKEVGAESLCLQILEQLQLPEFLRSQDWSHCNCNQLTNKS